jgi:hypothetical protein
MSVAAIYARRSTDQNAVDEVLEETGLDLERAESILLERIDERENPAFTARLFEDLASSGITFIVTIVEEEIGEWEERNRRPRKS